MTPEWAERFWDKVQLTSYHWLWAAGRFEDRFGEPGYGAFQLDGRARKAHHIMWMLTRGPIPPGLLVLHHCDLPPCVFPMHLYLGTAKDNARDREARHRRRVLQGENHPMARLTDADVADIRARYWSVPRVGSNLMDLAQEYGISRGHVRGIVEGRKRRAGRS